MSKELVKASLCGAGIIGSAIFTRQLNRYNRKKEYETLISEINIWYPKVEEFLTIKRQFNDVDESTLKEKHLQKSDLWKYVYTYKNIDVLKEWLKHITNEGIHYNVYDQ